MRKFLFLPVLLALAAPALAQNWQQRSGFPILVNGAASGDDKGIDIKIDSNGNAYICGSTETATQGVNYIVRKYNNSGGFVWSREVNSPTNGDDIPVQMAVDSAGAVFVTGTTFSGGSPVAYLTTKIDTNGNSQYALPYNLNAGAPAGADIANDIAVDNAGNCYVVGESFSGTNRDYVVQRYAGNTGTLTWSITKNGGSNGTDRGRGIVFKDGFVYVTGEIFVNAGDTDMGIGKFNAATGAQSWFTNYKSSLDGTAAGDDATGYEIDYSENNRVVSVGDRRVESNQNKGITPTTVWLNPTNGALLFPTIANDQQGQLFNWSNNNEHTVGRHIAMGKLFGTQPGIDIAYVSWEGYTNTLNATSYAVGSSNIASTDGNFGGGGGAGGNPADGPLASNDVTADKIGSGFGVYTAPQGFAPFVGSDIRMYRSGGGTVTDGNYSYDGGVGHDLAGGVALDQNDDVWVVGSQFMASGKYDIVILKIVQKPGVLFDQYNLFKNQSISIPASQGVKSNDVGSIGATAVLSATQNPAPVGTLTLASDGSFDYTPVPNTTGDDSFSYHLNKPPYGDVFGDTSFGNNVRLYIHPNILTLDVPASANGGQAVSGIIQMDGMNPSGGTAYGTASTVPNGVVTVPSPWSTGSSGTNQCFVGLYCQGTTSSTSVTVTVARNGIQASDTMTVNPGGLVSVTVNPNPIVGGNAATGTITLGTPAQSGGELVKLSSSSSFITVPPTATVPEGATTTTFGITTSAVNVSTVRTITAKAFGFSHEDNTRTVNVTLNPVPTLTNLTLSPTSVHGGQSTTGTVTLASAAPAGGVMVTTTDNSTAIGTPANVTVPEGSSSTPFSITTTQVGSTAVRVVSATLDAVTKNANLTIVPSPTLTNLGISPTVITGGESTTGTLTLSAAPTAGAVKVGLTDNSGSISTPAQGTVNTGSATGTFSITSSAVGAAATRTVTATLFAVVKTANVTLQPPAVLTALSITPNSIKGGNATTGTVTVSNPAGNGGAVVTLTDNSGSITTPASATVANNTTTKTFSITSSAVGTTATRTVTATRNGVSKTANLTLTP